MDLFPKTIRQGWMFILVGQNWNNCISVFLILSFLHVVQALPSRNRDQGEKWALQLAAKQGQTPSKGLLCTEPQMFSISSDTHNIPIL